MTQKRDPHYWRYCGFHGGWRWWWWCTILGPYWFWHYNDVIMCAMASQITSLTIYSGAEQRKHQSATPLAFVRGIHRWPMNSPHKWPVTWKMLPFDYVIIGGGGGERGGGVWSYDSRHKGSVNQNVDVSLVVSGQTVKFVMIQNAMTLMCRLCNIMGFTLGLNQFKIDDTNMNISINLHTCPVKYFFR